VLFTLCAYKESGWLPFLPSPYYTLGVVSNIAEDSNDLFQDEMGNNLGTQSPDKLWMLSKEDAKHLEPGSPDHAKSLKHQIGKEL
jgi:hypothetical protein